jgi:hypothetical protein
MRFVSATISQGTFSQSGGVVTFNLGSLSAGGTATATITVQLLEDGTVTNSSSVTSNAGDSSSSNNSATASTTVSEAPIVVSGPITTTTKRLSNVTVATFTHANGVEPASAFSATINWGDGKTSTGTITQSGTTYSVVGSHNYSKPTTRTITVTVTEISASAELLLGKIGDEVPELPDHLGTYHDSGRFSLNSRTNRFGKLVNGYIAPGTGGSTTSSTGGTDAAIVTRRDVITRLEALMEAGKNEGRAPELWPLLGRLRLQAPMNPRALEVALLIDELYSLQPW